ncbi:MAG: hypothetical protein RIR70_1106 [Pseudomonadota bacterium]|jgi:1-acyl-sn-glycerol-3-phosphate acyltransferase
MPSPAQSRLISQSEPPAKAALAVLQSFIAQTHPGRALRVTLDADFERDLALDSVSRMELALRLQEALGSSPPETAINEAATLRELLSRWALAPQSLVETLQKPPLTLPGPSESPLPHQAASLIDVLAWHAAREPSRRHVLLPGDAGEMVELGFHALLEGARRRASSLLARGVSPNTSVAIMLPTGREYLEVFFAVMIAGAFPVPIYPPTRLAQLAEHLQRHAGILANAQVATLITLREAKALTRLASGVASVLSPEDLEASTLAPLPKLSGSDIAFLQYTSGSTGEPKGVVLTHDNVLANIRAMGRAAKVTSEDVFVSWLPLYHDMGLIGAWLGSLYHACPLVLLSPLSFMAQPARWLHALTDFGGTLTAAPNFAFDICARRLPDEALRGIDLSRVRAMFNGAEPVSADTLEAFAQRFAKMGLRKESLVPVYGLAENTVGLAFSPIGRAPRIDLIERARFFQKRTAVPSADNPLRIPSCGRVLPDHEIRIVDDLGREVPERAVGRVQFRGPSATSGYFRNPEATATLFKDGWLDTGDYGYFADAELFLTGRAKDLIIRGGHNYYPYELEDAVGRLDGVRRGAVAVFAANDWSHGTEKLVVVAETREEDPAARQDLIRRIEALAVALIGVPAEEVVLVPPHSVLKTSSGKIRRAATRARFEQGLLGKTGKAWGAVAKRVLQGALERGRGRCAALLELFFGFYCWAVFLPIALVTWPLVAGLRAPRISRFVVHAAARATLWLTGRSQAALREAALPARPHVLMVNHASYLDVLILTAVLPPRIDYAFVAKRELNARWWSRFFLQGLGAVFVERGQALQSAQDAIVMTDLLLRGRSLIVFPEATFTRQSGLRPFHMGGFVAAARAAAPVATLALRGTRAVLRNHSYWPRWGKIEWQLGAVLVTPAADWAAAVRLRDATRRALSALCGEADLQET